MYEIHYMEPDAVGVLATLYTSRSYDITETVYNRLVDTSYDTTVLGIYNREEGVYIHKGPTAWRLDL